jgi:hypothetical protein
VRTRGAKARASQRRTRALGALALAAGGGLCAVELRHLARRADGPPGHATAAALRAGYHAGSARENAVFNVLIAFAGTLGAARTVTHLIRHGAAPFGNMVVGRRHIHHFVPGIAMALVAGGASIGLRHEELDKWLAIPFGAGAALVLDEAALLLDLEDVYWSRRGVLSVQISLGAAALLGGAGLGVRLVRRGEDGA